jgi:ABC-2 type transport system permease protein
MRNTWTIAKREFAHYFVSPIAYAVAIMFLVLLGFLFIVPVGQTAASAGMGGGMQPSMEYVFGPLVSLILFFSPVLTMRLLAEEQNKGTLELLLTAPVREWEVVVGKWLGAWMFGLVLLATTLIYCLILYAYGNPDTGPIVSGYLGLALLIGAILAVGLFASSLTGNLIVSVAIGYAFVLLIFIIGAASQLAQSVLGGFSQTQFIANTIKYLDFGEHYYSTFQRGTIETIDILYFVTVIVVALFLSVRVVEARRWR